jgi:sulfate transport system ATP-binding protein
MTIEVRHVIKRFNGFTALADVSLRVNPGELVALLGPSGSGKTTLLRIIAGLEFPTEGAVLFDGEDASARHVGQRRVGFVFQHYALFRHMTVFENVAFGLRVKPRRQRPAEAAIGKKVMDLLDLVQLELLAERYPTQLSGGQRQRVALARALAIEPKVLLLDEPFGALDAKVRKELRRWLRQLHDRMGLTSVFVTHDQEEALELADRIVVMSEGRIEQIGAPQQVYDHPTTAFVYEFLGHVNRFDCFLRHGRVDVCGGRFEVSGAESVIDGPSIAYVRPHDIDVVAAEDGPGAPAEVRYLTAAGPVGRIELALAGRADVIEAEISRARLQELALRVGSKVRIRARAARIVPAPAAAFEGPVVPASATPVARALAS